MQYVVAVSVGSESVRLYFNKDIIGTVEFMALGLKELWLARDEDKRAVFYSKKRACEEVAAWAGAELLQGFLRPSIRRTIGYDIISPEKKAAVSGWAKTIEAGIARLTRRMKDRQRNSVKGNYRGKRAI